MNKQSKLLYFIGIKGVAMAGLAVMAKQLGYLVRGSDVAETFPTDQLLHDNQIEVLEGFDGDHLKSAKPDRVIISAAYGLQNPEVKAAKAARIKMITQSEMLGEVMSHFEGVGVAGVHGKTTTSSMLTFVLQRAGFSPGYAIGTGSIPGLVGNARIGDGKYFVAEADEYKKSDLDHQPKFLDLPLKHVIITSIELDHPDVYATSEQMYDVFYQLTSKIPRNGSIIACSDYPLVRRLIGRIVDRPVLSYGFDPAARYLIGNVVEDDDAVTFTVTHEEESIGPFTIKLPGRHNILNATAAALMAIRLGVSTEAVTAALKEFQGPQRRFELLGELNGAKVFDDYAHHPTAISYLIEAARERFPDKRIVLVFQPHTYSRTGKLLKEFARSLSGADKLILLNIWASAREKSGYVTIRDLIRAVAEIKPDVEYRGSLEEAANYLQSFVNQDDVVFLVGAGDVYKIYEKLQAAS